LYKPFSWGYLRNNKQFGSDKQFSETFVSYLSEYFIPYIFKGDFFSALLKSWHFYYVPKLKK
jgi:hypothetical protein